MLIIDACCRVRSGTRAFSIRVVQIVQGDEAVIFCTKCGQKLEAGSQFCTSCGAPVAATAQPAAPVSVQPPARLRGSRHRSSAASVRSG